MMKLDKQKPKKINGRYFLHIPKNIIDTLGIDETVFVEIIVDVKEGTQQGCAINQS